MEHYNETQSNQCKKRRRRRRRVPLVTLILAAVLIIGVVWVLTGGPGGRRRTLSITDSNGERTVIKGIPEELVELAEHNPEALEFVRSYPELHDQHPDIDLTAEAQSGSVPHLLQWDTRWGYEGYGSGMIACTGCGPTCLSMTALYLTRNADFTPLAVANYSEEHGYYAEGQGTSWTLISQGCEEFGLSAEELPWVESRMKEALDAGNPIICAMGAGDFTTTGHYIVVTGYDKAGFTVNDPNSYERSEQRWTFERLTGQVRNLWSMSAK